MTGNVLDVQGLGKAYREYSTEWLRFASWFGYHSRRVTQNWVLRDISFNMAPGEAIGVVGQNGAGKSTLLKLITGTLGATEGSVHVQGRISAILELGMGFNPDLTGRQNVYHSAGLMGFTRKQIESVIEEIRDFAEIGGYFDEPVRTYSSGMQMRVAFSVASAFRPDILIVDEALSVGDAYFQHKCFRRIREFREQGTSLLIVSHEKAAVQAMCDRAILLDSGAMLSDGLPSDIMDLYNALLAEREKRTVEISEHSSGRKQTISGSGEATVVEIQMLDADGDPVEFVNVGADVTLRVLVRVDRPVERLVFGYLIQDRLGQAMYGTNTHYTEQVIDHAEPGNRIEYRVRFPMNLGPGSYSVSTALTSSDTHLVDNYEWRDLALVFNVANVSRTKFSGIAWIQPNIELTRL